VKISWVTVRDAAIAFWQKLTKPQKIITIAAPLLVITLLTTLIIWASTPQYAPLFTKLADTEAGEITSKLSELNITYELAGNGSTILVKQQDVAATRLALANEGLPTGSKFSFDYLDQMRLGETDSDRKIRYVLALQNELENTLKTLDGIEEARVHMVQPETTLFSEQSKPTTATATLKLAKGTILAEESIQGIANLLTGSIEGLTLENVTILDTSGNTLSEILSDAANPVKLNTTQYQQQLWVESTLQRSLQTMLERALGTNSAVVRVNAVLDYDQIKIIQQTFGPGALVSRQETSETVNSAEPGAVPGVVSNVPGYNSPSATGAYASSAWSNTENYNNDNTQREQVVNPGAVKRLTISVLLDSDNSAVRQTTTDQVQGIVASAAGIDETRGDQVQVAAIPFDKTDQEAMNQAIADTAAREKMLRVLQIAAALFLLLLVLVILWIRRRRAKRAAQALLIGEEFGEISADLSRDLLKEQAEVEAEALARLEEKMKKSADDIEKEKIREAVDIYARNNPDDVANLIKTWLTEDK
jgi:flagellar M-ring protein FliF